MAFSWADNSARMTNNGNLGVMSLETQEVFPKLSVKPVSAIFPRFCPPPALAEDHDAEEGPEELEG